MKVAEERRHVCTKARLTRADAVRTGDILRRLDARWKVAIVGDAAMHPAELAEPDAVLAEAHAPFADTGPVVPEDLAARRLLAKLEEGRA